MDYNKSSHIPTTLMHIEQVKEACNAGISPVIHSFHMSGGRMHKAKDYASYADPPVVQRRSSMLTSLLVPVQLEE